jgi:hypothetical protein
LAIPRLNILGASDRIVTIAAMMNAVGVKLESRLSQATDIANLPALRTALADYAAKIADAGSEAQAAVALIAPLAPDGGDKDKMTANRAVIKDARAKIVAAHKSLVDARKDADTVIKALVKYDKIAMKTATSTTATTSTSTP